MQVCAVHWQSVINSFRGTGCTCADCTSMYPKVYGASVCVITDSRALSRKSSTVTILETLFIHFHPPKAWLLLQLRLVIIAWPVFVDLLLVDDTFPDENNTTNCYIDIRMYVVLNLIVKLKEKKCYSELFGDVCAKHKRRPSMPARPYFLQNLILFPTSSIIWSETVRNTCIFKDFDATSKLISHL